MKKSLTFLIALIVVAFTSQAQNTWTQKADFGGTARSKAVGFSIGSKGYIGTGSKDTYPYCAKDFWEYDLDANTWTQKADFGGSARYSATGFSIGNKGYIGTGLNISVYKYYKDFWEYDPSTNKWTQKADFGGSARYFATGFSIDNKGYIGTGYDDVVNKKDFWEYDPDANTWSKKADFGGSARFAATGFSVDSMGYIGMGNYNQKDFWEYNPNANIWTKKADFGGGSRETAIGFGLGGKGYVGMGYKYTDEEYYYKDFWEYDPGNNTWIQKAEFGGSARFSSTGFSIENRGYIGTGMEVTGVVKKDFWEYTPEVCIGVTVYADADSDGYGNASNSYFTTDCITSGYVYNSTDCNDNNASIHPEACDPANGNGIDDNCDSAIDDGFGTTTYYIDADGDGYGAGLETSLCNNPGTGYSIYSTDCNDNNASIHPGACDAANSNEIDENCDGAIDNGFGATTYYADSDSDGYGAEIGISFCSDPGSGYLANNTDCDDANGSIYPGLPEIINGIDDNCDGIVDGNLWVQKSDLGYNAPNVPAPTARSGAVGFSIGSKGYIGTGYDIETYKRDFWEYDPAANTWTQKADFGGIARSNAVGFSIGSKGYVGTGYRNGDKKDFWEYDAAANSWTPKADFAGTARSGAIGFSIDSKGYIGTGSGNGYKKDFWEYDPDADTWTQKTDFGGSARSSAVGFSVGSKGYIGTGSDGVYKNDFWEYDPDINTWMQKADFGGSARSSAIGFSVGSKGYIGTGAATDGDKKDFWEYNTDINTWTQKADFGGTVRSSAVGFSVSNKGYIGIGYNYGYKEDFWEYDPVANTWTKKADFGSTAQTNAASFSIDTKGYIMGAKDFWEYDPDANTWTQKADFGGTARSSAVGFSLGSRGYIGTGYDGVYKNDFWEYDPDANTWTQKADFGGSARYDAVGFSIVSKGYIGTGYDGTYKKDLWEYDPDANTWSQKADFAGSARYSATGFSIGNKGYIGTGDATDGRKKDLWEYNPDANTWSQKADFGGSSRSSAVGFSISNKGYIGTGYSIGILSITHYSDFWEYDPGANTWTQKADFGGGGRSSATGFSIGSKGYIGTGYSTDGEYDENSNYYKDFWEYTPDNVPCSAPASLSVTNITSSSAKLKWEVFPGVLGYKVRYKVAGTTQWTNIQSIDNDKTLKGLAASTEYKWQVKSICATQPIVSSDWSAKQTFITESLRISDVPIAIGIEIYPNPADGNFTLQLQSNSEESTGILQVIDMMGRIVYEQKITAIKGVFQQEIQLNDAADGMYLVKVIVSDRVYTKQLVISKQQI